METAVEEITTLIGKKSNMRKPISKNIRFEVFKRDLFTCQYCGKKAPDVILNVDHVNPVAKGGLNDMLNLITSCFDCNSGKGKRELSDTSVIDKQRKQIEELQERKNQIEMLLDWKLSLANITEDENRKVIQYYNSKWEEFSLSEQSEKKIKGCVKKYGAIAVIEMIDECYKKYGQPHNEEKSFSYVLAKVVGTLNFNSQSAEEQQQTILIRQALSILRSRFYTFDYDTAARAISSFTRRGGTGEELLEITNEADSWSEWKQMVY